MSGGLADLAPADTKHPYYDYTLNDAGRFHSQDMGKRDQPLVLGWHQLR